MTAVQWLLDRIEDVDNTSEIWEQIKVQANKMFEQQIIVSFEMGRFNIDDMGCGEEYYNETYGSKINLVEIPQEQLEKERNPNYEYFSIDEPKTSQLPGVNVNDVKPSNPQMVKENFSPQVDKQRMYSEDEVIEFTMNMISQYVVGNTNIWDRDRLKETLKLKK